MLMVNIKLLAVDPVKEHLKGLSNVRKVSNCFLFHHSSMKQQTNLFGNYHYRKALQWIFCIEAFCKCLNASPLLVIAFSLINVKPSNDSALAVEGSSKVSVWKLTSPFVQDSASGY